MHAAMIATIIKNSRWHFGERHSASSTEFFLELEILLKFMKAGQAAHGCWHAGEGTARISRWALAAVLWENRTLARGG
jgi:hypothetical protein